LLSTPAEQNEQKASPPEKYLYQRLARHFSAVRPQELITTSRNFPLRQQADLQKALDDLSGERRIPENFFGVHQQYRHEGLTFSKLLDQGHYPVEAAPAQYEDVNIGGGETIPSLKNGVCLLHDHGVAYAVVLAQQDDYGRGSNIIVEIAASPGEIALELCTQVFHSLELRLSKESCYRGRIISLQQQYQYSGRASRIAVTNWKMSRERKSYCRNRRSDLWSATYSSLPLNVSHCGSRHVHPEGTLYLMDRLAQGRHTASSIWRVRYTSIRRC
jgi:hypothetical protein